MSKNYFLFLITFLVVITISCAPEGTFERILGPDYEMESYDMYNELNKDVDTDKIVGNVSFYSVVEQDIHSEIEDAVNADYVYVVAKANPDMDNSDLKLNELIINDKNLTPIFNGKVIRAWGYPDVEDDISFYYGNELNSISVTPTDFFNGVDTLISLGNKLQLSGIATGDTIFDYEDFKFEWNENTGKYVEIFFHGIGPLDDVDYGNSPGLFEYDERFIAENKSSYTFFASALSKIYKGEFLLSVTSYDRKFLYDNEGRIFMATIISKDEKRIFLTE